MLVAARRARLTVFVGSLLMLSMLALIPSSAQTPWEQVDQSVPLASSGTEALRAGTRLAQTFTAGMSGELARVDLGMAKQEGDLLVEIRTATSNDPLSGEPSDGAGDLLASATVATGSGTTVVRFDEPALVEANTLYAIVVSTPGRWAWREAESSYDDGRARACTPVVCWGHAGAVDYGFTTYVREPDSTLPTGTVSIDNGAEFTNSTSVTLSLTCSDTISGCSEMALSHNGIAFSSRVPYASSYEYSLEGIDGEKSVYVRFYDQANNQSIDAVDSITLDTTPPSTTIDDGPDAVTDLTVAGFTFLSDTPLATFECSRTSGATTTPYEPCSSSYLMSGLTDGTYTLSVRAKDRAGNVDPTPATWSWRVDSVGPTVTIEKAADQPDPTNGTEVRFDIVFSEPVTNFQGTEIEFVTSPGLDFRGLSMSPATVPGGWGDRYTVTFSLITGEGTIEAFLAAGVAVDAAGNPNQASTSTDNVVMVDQVAPTTTAHVSGPNQNNWYRSATVSLTPDEPGTTTYWINGIGPQTYTSPFALPGDGVHAVTYWSVDALGNEESTKSTTIWVDGTAPVFQPIADQTLDPTSPAGAPVVFTPVVTDNLSSLGAITATCVDQQGNPFVSGQFAPAGVTTITCTATDLAGNMASESFVVTVRGVDALFTELDSLLIDLDLDGSIERTMLTQAALAELFANSGQPAMACMQLTSLDMQVKAQESRRRITARDAREIYTLTQQIRNVIGCGAPPA